jgi:hypothetical protein
MTLDLAFPGQWANAMRLSNGIWDRFIGQALKRGDAFIDDMLPRAGETVGSDRTWMSIAVHGYANSMHPEWTDGIPDRDPAERRRRASAIESDLLASRLAHVNAHIVIAAATASRIHDWADFGPYYLKKLSSKSNGDLDIAANSLFDIAFPEFRVDSAQHLLRILRHRRLTDLRRLIQDASEGNVIFDAEFARQTLHAVIDVDHRLNRYRRFVGYASAPLGTIPIVGNLLQLATQEVADALIKAKLTKDYRWFYMLSALAAPREVQPHRNT